MSAFSDRMVGLEARLLERFGANGTLGSSEFAYNPDTNRMEDTPGESQVVRMTVGPAETLDEQGREVFRTVAKMQVEPRNGQKLTFAGKTYTVGNVVTLYEADVPTLYVAEVSE